LLWFCHGQPSSGIAVANLSHPIHSKIVWNGDGMEEDTARGKADG
jgi:hypothetical protein